MFGRATITIVGAFAMAAVGGLVSVMAATNDGATPAPIVVAQMETVTPPPPLGAEFNEAQRAEINELIGAYIVNNPGFIRDYLMTNPEILTDVVAELEARRADQEAVRQADAIASNYDLLFNSPRQVVLGNPNGDVTLVEFFDYNCTYCRAALADMNRLVADDPNLRVILKEFPVLGPGSTEAAQVASAVLMVAPERYDAFHQNLLGGQVAASVDSAVAAAVAAGIDPTMLPPPTDPEVIATIDESYAVAGALGLTGTPSYIIGSEVIVGAVGYDALKARIDAMRACGSTTCL